MRRILAISFVLGLLLALAAVTSAVAGTRQAVTMTVTTIFDPDPDAFTATGLPRCTSGTVTDANAKLVFTPAPGIYAGYKVLDCGSGNGFVVRLNARFFPGGATGTWTVVDAWGSLTGMTGGGRLSAEPIGDIGVTDFYTGTVTF